MLRKIVQVGRKRGSEIENESHSSTDASTDGKGDEHAQDETWVDWIQRATEISEQLAWKFGVSDWVRTQRKRYFLWAGHVARREDGRWARQVLDWFPIQGYRARGHPKQRWADKIKDFVKQKSQSDWTTLAMDRISWATLADEFAPM